MKKRIMLTIVCAVLACTSLASFAAAAETIIVENIEVVASETDTVSECSTRAEDLIEYYYKTVNGYLYVRRWNASQNYWIDSDWICMGIII